MTQSGRDRDTALSALGQAKDDLEQIASALLKARTMTRPEREDLGRKINAARARITTAQIALEIDTEDS